MAKEGPASEDSDTLPGSYWNHNTAFHLIVGDFLDERLLGRNPAAVSATLDLKHFDLITCVAALHHMEFEPALGKMRSLLTPGGSLRIVGLAANKTLIDWIISGLVLVPIRFLSLLHGQSTYPNMRVTDSRMNLSEIKKIATP